MKPDKLTIHELFQRERRYVVPLYQRPYVWTRQDQWEPLWEDIERQAEACLHSPQHTTSRSHFLGAIVLNVSRIVGAGVARSEVIDGQQRLTTLQIFIAALRDLAASTNSAYTSRIRRLTVNEDECPDSEGSFKVWPTNADRQIFRNVLTAQSPERLTELVYRETMPRMAQAYSYFYSQLHGFVHEASSEPAQCDQRIFAVLQALRTALQVVVIELEDEDDPQVIFETLNARGQPLLPSDLIRNYLFMRASHDPALDADRLYEKYWRDFDDARVAIPEKGEDRFWHVEERQGRLTRPRIDLFLFHYLTMQTETDVLIGSLFREFRDWRDRQNIPVEALLSDLRHYGSIFAELIDPKGSDRKTQLARRLKALDTSTVYPLLLYIIGLPSSRLTAADRERLLSDLESWLVRRFVCQLTNKNYNRFFVSLLAKVKQAPTDANLADIVRDELERGRDVTTSWPSQGTFRQAWLNKPIYAKSRPDRSGMVLRAIEHHMRTRRNEAITLPNYLTVEHLLPQKGSRADYPFATEGLMLGEETAEQCRDRLVHTLGNLTLLTSELNSSASNGPFSTKTQKIVADSDLRLNAWLRHNPPLAWDERSILMRGEELFASALQIWPMPTDTDDDTIFEAEGSTNADRLEGHVSDQALQSSKKRAMLVGMSNKLCVAFRSDSVSKHRSIDDSKRIALSISKRYDGRAGYPYWYAFHPDWNDYLAASSEGYFVVGMMDRNEAYAIPLLVLQPLLPSLNTTVRPQSQRLHWHVHIVEEPSGVALLLPKLGYTKSIEEYKFPLSNPMVA